MGSCLTNLKLSIFFVDPDQIHEDVGLGQVIVEIHGVAVVGEHPGVPVGVPHEAHLQDGRPGMAIPFVEFSREGFKITKLG